MITIVVNEAMEGVCKIYEEQLKKERLKWLLFSEKKDNLFKKTSFERNKENSSQHSITYDISQLFDYIDNLTDLSGTFSVITFSAFSVQISKTISVLVYQRASMAYAPYNKDWVKEKIYIMLRKQAGLWQDQSSKTLERPPLANLSFSDYWSLSVFLQLIWELSFHANENHSNILFQIIKMI